MLATITALILLSTEALSGSAETPRAISINVVEPGGNVTLTCRVTDRKSRIFNWYKQRLGYTLDTVAWNVDKSKLTEQTSDSRITVSRGEEDCTLTIRNVSKDDEATYFCQSGTVYRLSFADGTFLVVTDENQQRLGVKLTPETVSVQPGEQVFLQCSLLSENKVKSGQCPSEDKVYWFRSETGSSHPGLIYTQGNRSQEKSCRYSLSTKIQDSSDTGTYFCAVVTCGQVLFSEGTPVTTSPKLQSVVLVLGILLACCLTTIFVLLVLVIKFQSRIGKQDEDAVIVFSPDTSSLDPLNTVEDEANSVNYASLRFPARKMNKTKEKRRDVPPGCLYSVVE